ncbi:unnamed protein product, partial [Amoebophrya sp. A25]|eukprot:GSA25T00009664001.1
MKSKEGHQHVLSGEEKNQDGVLLVDANEESEEDQQREKELDEAVAKAKELAQQKQCAHWFRQAPHITAYTRSQIYRKARESILEKGRHVFIMQGDAKEPLKGTIIARKSMPMTGGSISKPGGGHVEDTYDVAITQDEEQIGTGAVQQFDEPSPVAIYRRGDLRPVDLYGIEDADSPIDGAALRDSAVTTASGKFVGTREHVVGISVEPRDVMSEDDTFRIFAANPDLELRAFRDDPDPVLPRFRRLLFPSLQGSPELSTATARVEQCEVFHWLEKMRLKGDLPIEYETTNLASKKQDMITKRVPYFASCTSNNHKFCRISGNENDHALYNKQEIDALMRFLESLSSKTPWEIPDYSDEDEDGADAYASDGDEDDEDEDETILAAPIAAVMNDLETLDAEDFVDIKDDYLDREVRVGPPRSSGFVQFRWPGESPLTGHIDWWDKAWLQHLLTFVNADSVTDSGAANYDYVVARLRGERLPVLRLVDRGDG